MLDNIFNQIVLKITLKGTKRNILDIAVKVLLYQDITNYNLSKS